MSSIYLFYSVIFTVFLLISGVLRKAKLRYYSDSAFATFFGLFLGLSMRLFTNSELKMPNSVFVEVLLPVIIMGGAREVDLKLFYQNFNYIILYGVGGTFLNFIGLFVFVFLLGETFDIATLSKSNRLLISSAVISCFDFNGISSHSKPSQKGEIS